MRTALLSALLALTAAVAAHAETLELSPTPIEVAATIEPTTTSTAPATRIQLNWTWAQNCYPVCPVAAPGSTWCATGFTIVDQTVSGTPTIVSATVPISVSSAATYSYTFPAPPFTVATRTYAVSTNYLDGSGTQQTTASATGTVDVSATFALAKPGQVTGTTLP